MMSETREWLHDREHEDAARAAMRERGQQRKSTTRGRKMVKGAATYRSRTTVRAIRFDGSGDSCDAVGDFLAAEGAAVTWKPCTNDGATVRTIDGESDFEPGDFIVAERRGLVAVLPADVFGSLYEPVEDVSLTTPEQP